VESQASLISKRATAGLHLLPRLLRIMPSMGPVHPHKSLTSSTVAMTSSPSLHLHFREDVPLLLKAIAPRNGARLGARSSAIKRRVRASRGFPSFWGSLPHDPMLRSRACDSEGASQVGGRRSDCPPTPFHRWAVPDRNLTRRRHRGSRVPPPECCNTADIPNVFGENDRKRRMTGGTGHDCCFATQQ
jgi:hypothetical protein